MRRSDRAPLRFLTDRAPSSGSRTIPSGTFAVNVVGSLILGVIAAAANPSVATLVGTGFCGAPTTYSTFSYETFALIEGRDRLIGVVNVVGSVVVGVAAATAGWAWGRPVNDSERTMAMNDSAPLDETSQAQHGAAPRQARRLGSSSVTTTTPTAKTR